MKRKLLITFFLIIVLSLSSVSFASTLQIEDININFDIEPKEINNNTYIPIEQFKQLKNFSMYSIEDNMLLIIYDSNYYAFSLNNREIKSSIGNFNICCEPLKINDHVLVPVQLIEKILGQRLSGLNDINQTIDLKVILKQQSIEDKDILNVLIKINNLSNEEKTLEFRTSQKYNILIKDKDNNVLYNWEKGKMFTQAFTYSEIEGMSSIEFIEKIDISDFENGNYSLVLILKSNNYDIEKKQVQFSINK